MKDKLAFLILILLVFSSIHSLVSADIGPKPTVDIYITLNGQNIPDVSFNAKMLTCNYQMKYEQIITELAPYEKSGAWYDKCQEVAPKYGFDKESCFGDLQNQIGMTNLSEQARCEDKSCEKLIQKIPDNNKKCYWTIAPLTWGGNCQNSNCHFTYMLPQEFRLAVYLPSQNKTFLSESTKRENFYSTFDAKLLPDGRVILNEVTTFKKSDDWRSIKSFLIALVLTLVIELLVVSIYLLITKISKKVLLSVLVVNLISLPFVWFIFPLITAREGLVILLAEVFAFVFEGYLIYLINKKRISLKSSFILSLVMNLASLLIGGFLFYVFIRLGHL